MINEIIAIVVVWYTIWFLIIIPYLLFTEPGQKLSQKLIEKL